MTDVIKKPNHYMAKLPNGEDVECWQVQQALGFDRNYALGNVLKYIWRAGKKEGQSRDKDLQKAIRYLEMELERTKHRKNLYVRQDSFSIVPGTKGQAKYED